MASFASQTIGSCISMISFFGILPFERFCPFHGFVSPSIRTVHSVPTLALCSIQALMITRLSELRIVHFDYVHKPQEIDIFSLSTGTWRNISHVALPDININERAHQAFLNGAAHWVASKLRSYGGSFLIVSFHMDHEKFSQIILPHNIMAHDSGLGSMLMSSALYFGVAKFQESLAVIHFTGPEDNTCCIWVMKKYGVRESWTKQFYFDMTGTFNTLAGFSRKGELLLATSDGYLVAHDPEAGRTTHLLIRGTTHETYIYSFYADAYTESLVLLGKRFCDTGTSEESSPGAVEGRCAAEEIKNRFVTGWKMKMRK
ncbi:F-box/kelch-repeat protein At3g06240-like [Cornus florida]|uniref:F-box/kelch-repeat protein At3g06240-like n=1 Tax=Cornus florida TaxID=4283 RepID=UPI0028992847|nr:F-box/kelch-repeat protein At3g06240-like [Cornus florida]